MNRKGVPCTSEQGLLKKTDNSGEQYLDLRAMSTFGFVMRRSCSLAGQMHKLCTESVTRSVILSKRNYNKIYTRTGDKGTSSTYTGERRPKDDALFVALGTTDELSSSLGLSAEFCIEGGHPLEKQIRQIQCMLQDAGSVIATPSSSARDAHKKNVNFDNQFVHDLECWIDEMSEELPPLKNFILPSGGKAACSLHMARSICRRAERSLAPLIREEEISHDTLRFLNRLSDFLFTAARFCAMREGREEEIYLRPKDRKS